LLILFKERFEIVEKVWILKEKHWIQPLDSSRWSEVLKSKIELWKNIWINEEFIKNVWENIHKNALKIEKK
jgi:chorismate mutase